MPTLEIVNSEQHRQLRMRAPIGPTPHFVPIILAEFASAAASCPIFLAKDPETGRFYAGAMFGFRPGENLVDEDSGGPGAFVPLDVERQGFFTSEENIVVDVEHPRVNGSEGEPLFDDDGQPGEAMRRVQRALGLLVKGTQDTEAFIQAMVDHRLIEPVDISLRFDDGEDLALAGLYTVSLDAIADLEDADVLMLFRSGYLRLAYTVSGSLRQIPVLANRRNRRLAGGLEG
jgi:hypothetical protein